MTDNGNDDLKLLARAAFNRIERFETDLLSRWPDLWQRLDDMRRNPGGNTWPSWCLLPMGAPAAVLTANGQMTWPPPPIATAAALYAWRFSRSVFYLEPSLAERMVKQVPDALELDDFTGLPQWCPYVIAGPDAGFFIHLEYDMTTGRPELRVLLDLNTPDSPIPIPVYLDRDSVTEALGDFRATALRHLEGARGQDVRGGELDRPAADLAEKVETYLAIGAYLARPEADIAEAGRPGVRPAPGRRPVSGRGPLWLVGYGDQRGV